MYERVNKGLHFTLEQKDRHAIIAADEKDVADEFGITLNTLSTILRYREKLALYSASKKKKNLWHAHLRGHSSHALPTGHTLHQISVRTYTSLFHTRKEI